MSERGGAALFKHPRHEKRAPWGHKEKGRKETVQQEGPLQKWTLSISLKKTSAKSLKEVRITEGSHTKY